MQPEILISREGIKAAPVRWNISDIHGSYVGRVDMHQADVTSVDDVYYTYRMRGEDFDTQTTQQTLMDAVRELGYRWRDWLKQAPIND